MPTAAFMNLGCKVNQYETERLSGSFQDLGFEIVDFRERADVYVVNTCSVTADADKKSRYTARKAARTNPDARVVLTGCFAQMALDTGESVVGASLLIPNRDKMRAAEHTVAAFPDLCQNVRLSVPQPFCPPDALFPLRLSTGGFITPADVLQNSRVTRTRATLKVQDGCRHFCAFCSIPYTRSLSASRPYSDIISEARELAAGGAREIVVTGVCVGAYGQDLPVGHPRLADVLAAVAEIPNVERVRLSSVQPVEVGEDIIAAMVDHPRIAPHLHLSLQSGDDTILKLMGRPYDTEFYRDLVGKIRSAIPHVGLTTDIIVGFPGETEELFNNTFQFAQEIGFAGTHVFRYSPRQRTTAANLVDDVEFTVKERRHLDLTRLALQSQKEFINRFIGKTMPVLVEARGTVAGIQSGYTDNYIRIQFPSEIGRRGEMVAVKVQGTLSGGDAFGEIVE